MYPVVSADTVNMVNINRTKFTRRNNIGSFHWLFVVVGLMVKLQCTLLTASLESDVLQVCHLVCKRSSANHSLSVIVIVNKTK